MIAWVLISAALVILMVVGLGLFYGALSAGSTRVGMQHALSHVVLCLVIVSLQFSSLGYGLAFGRSLGGLLGVPGTVADTWSSTVVAPGLPGPAFVIFQLAFAVITAALVYDGGAWRFRLSAPLICAWTTLVYDPVAHWVWGDGGWLRAMGALDFAGGTVVHVVAGASVLALASVSGAPRPRVVGRPIDARDLVLGTALLWVGWFGFNGGSALTDGESAARAVLATHLAACAGAVTWRFASLLLSQNGPGPMVFDLCVGAIAGLVAITPAAGYVGPLAAIMIGAVAGSVCRTASEALHMRVDDPMEVIPVHGVGGLVGAVLTGCLATDGGGLRQAGIQVVAVLAVGAYAYLTTWAVALAARYLAGGRDQ